MQAANDVDHLSNPEIQNLLMRAITTIRVLVAQKALAFLQRTFA
jgi:hypothetical protein